MLRPDYPLYLANRPQRPNLDLVVHDKFSGAVATRVPLAGPAELEQAIAAAEAAADAMRRLPTYARQEVLYHCVRRCEERREELAQALCVEAGKPIKDSRGEVGRLIDTFRTAAEEAPRLHGEVMALDVSPRAHGYRGLWKRVPVGPVSLIAPFNFPLNLAAHKVAPALAVGCPFVLKPASATPVGALLIGEILAECQALPAGAFSILPCPGSAAGPLVEDERLKLLSFTGSPQVGWELKARAGRKKVALELGGNAAVVVDRDADLDDVVRRVVFGAFYQSGQSCVSVQRVLIHASIYDELRARLVEATRALVAGDPSQESTFVGPLIAEREAVRLCGWIDDAVQAGARVLCGGRRRGAILEATLLEEVPRRADLWAREAFGPVACLAPFEEFEAALREVNDSAFGLQAGVFTRDLHRALRAWDELEVGGVIVNDVPSWRADPMPYGGVKQSGLGREGVRFAMEEMTEIRLLAIRDAAR